MAEPDAHSDSSSIIRPETGSFKDNGLYTDGMWDRLEKVWDYDEGGHHPVLLDDCFGDSGQYRVIHKLGNGGYANVWLCRVLNTEPTEYVALKILMADASEGNCPERLVFELQDLAKENPSIGEYVCLPLDHFQITGPNGSHLCIVYPLQGCEVVPLWKQVDDPNKMLRSLVRQAIEAMATMHRAGICHGDFRPPNILLRASGLSGMSEDEVLDYLEPPRTANVLDESGNIHSNPRAPPYLVYPVTYFPENSSRTSDKLCVIDFGEAFKISDPPPDLGIPFPYAAPETLFGESPSPASDIWALGCTIYEIRTGKRLFALFEDSMDDYLGLVADMLGRFPEPWWSSWENRLNYFPEKPGPRAGIEPRDLREELSKRIGHLPLQKSGRDEFVSIPEDEQELFADLIEKMFEYDVRKRLSAEEALQHPWFAYEHD
ncbi:kinase-like domain-containing protein [Aspergillus unguis]